MPADFHEQLDLLIELQEIDLNLHKFQLRLDELPEQIRAEEEAFGAVKDELAATKTELKETEHQKKTDESELADSVEHLRVREAKLYAIKTNKEYQAALKEISEGKRINREREDRILQSMEKIEALTQKSTQLEQVFADNEGALKAKRTKIDAEAKEIGEHMERDRAHRPELEPRIEKNILRKYEFVRRRYPEALALIRNGACEGCLRRLPPQLINEMMRHEEFKTCPNCQRIIHLEIQREGEG